ncbi:MAG: chromate transporter [Burkholderiaceae bacterium]|nr:chromate transporter [Burkholderiaceae bacterium]
MNSRSLSEVLWYFLGLSMVAIGGANALIPEMHHQLVELRGWLSSSDFVSLVALSQAAPGPNVLIVSLLGWKVAGIPGALVATAAMCIPSSLATFFFIRFWQRFQQSRWRAVVQEGLVPVTIGLIAASGYVLTREADHGAPAYAVTILTAVAMVRTRIHPLWMLAGAAALGALNIV